MDVLRRLIIAFTIRETSPRYWLVLIAALLTFVVPAVILSTNDVSVPAAPRIAYSLLIVTLAGIAARVTASPRPSPTPSTRAPPPRSRPSTSPTPIARSPASRSTSRSCP